MNKLNSILYEKRIFHELFGWLSFISSVIIGIFGCVCCLEPIWVVAIIPIFFGVLSLILKESNKSEAIKGIVIGSIELIVFVALVIASMTYDSGEENITPVNDLVVEENVVTSNNQKVADEMEKSEINNNINQTDISVPQNNLTSNEDKYTDEYEQDISEEENKVVISLSEEEELIEEDTILEQDTDSSLEMDEEINVVQEKEEQQPISITEKYREEFNKAKNSKEKVYILFDIVSKDKTLTSKDIFSLASANDLQYHYWESENITGNYFAEISDIEGESFYYRDSRKYDSCYIEMQYSSKNDKVSLLLRDEKGKYVDGTDNNDYINNRN